MGTATGSIEMEIIIAIGVEEQFAWSNLDEQLNSHGISIFSPLLLCRDFIDEELAIEPDQGNLERLVVRLRDTIEEEARATFWRRFLWELRIIERGNDVLSPEGQIRHLVLMSDIITFSDIAALKKAHIHRVRVLSYGTEPGIVGEIHHEAMPDLDQFHGTLLTLFGFRQEEPEPEELEEEEEPVEESA